MAIARMKKVIIASHRSEVAELLEALQQAGTVEILNAEQAMVSKEWPELHIEAQRPKDLEDMVARLEKSIGFLKDNATEKDQSSFFTPLIEIDKSKYSQVVEGKEAIGLLEETEQKQAEIERLETEHENTRGSYELLIPWKSLETPVEEIGELKRTSCISGLIPNQYYDEIAGKIGELGAAIQRVGTTRSMHACLVVCLSETASDVQKALRAGDFESISFEGMTGTVGSLLAKAEEKMALIGVDLGKAREKAGEYSKDRLSLQILYDHYQNLLERERKRSSAPATENVVLLEGWVKEKDYGKAEEIIRTFSASGIEEMEIAKGEVPPVEIENSAVIRPFEMVTRLYGMPAVSDVDPTLFLAPFFAIFFGLCLTDAGYGLVMIAALAYFLKKMQGDKKLMWMLMTCSILTVIAGALTGSWFGNAIQEFIPGLEPVRVWILGFGFDPLVDPMKFFGLSLALGYLQILFGLTIALVHNLMRKDYIAAVCDQLTWLVMLNSIVIFGASKAGVINPALGSIFGKVALVPAVMIVLFSERKGGWGGKLGMGAYQLFSTIFFMGDVLSYLRLMALGMVTAGLGIAINVITKIAGDIPYVGWLIGAMVFVGGHLFNLAISGLSAFVHTLRLQYVEFFPKFLAGGGKLFEPLREGFKHIYVKSEKEV